jgi:hypothetical protein
MAKIEIPTATEQRENEAELAELLAEYYRLAEPEMEREGDFLWQIVERFIDGKQVGWFVEHDGDVYQLDPRTGEDGPHPTRATAVQVMIEHLRDAIVLVRSWQ